MLKKTAGILFLIIVILSSLFLGLFFGSENRGQFDKTDTVRWSTANMFGEEDKSRFPDISSPVYSDKKQAEVFLDDNDTVLIYRSGGKLYAYPVSILTYHHIVNDTIDGKAVAITLCLLSDSAIVYDRKVGDEILSFGVLGSLYWGNLVMYDKITNSYWLQLTGEAFEGYHTKDRLSMITPLEISTWGKIKETQNLKILSPIRDMKFYREYYKNAYQSPFALESLKDKNTDKRLPVYTSGIGIEVRGKQGFYPINKIMKREIINDSVNGWSVLVIFDKTKNSYRMFRRYVNGKTLTFEKRGDEITDLQTKSSWDISGKALSGPLKGTHLIKPVYTQVYWFTWSSFFPQTNILN